MALKLKQDVLELGKIINNIKSKINEMIHRVTQKLYPYNGSELEEAQDKNRYEGAVSGRKLGRFHTEQCRHF